MIVHMPDPTPASHRTAFVRKIARALRRRCGVRRGHSVLLAVSGGADSVALAHAVAALRHRKEWQLDVGIGHVHHHLRAEADQDAQFVADLADRLGLPLEREDVEVDRSGNLEAVARRVRLDALGKMAERFQAAFVVTAHHGDDQLETILMRLLRGTSTRGISAMAWRRPMPVRVAEDAAAPNGTDAPKLRLTTDPRPVQRVQMIRPMLAVDHEQACDFLRTINQPWREDHTNQDRSRWRARLRAEVTPVLKDLRPTAATRAVELADHLRDVSQLVRESAEAMRAQIVSAAEPGKLFVFDRLAAAPMRDCVLIEMIREMLGELNVPADRATRRKLEPVLTAIRDRQQRSRHFDFGQQVEIQVREQMVTLIRWTDPPGGGSDG